MANHEHLNTLSFQSYRKIAPVRVRQLTQEDYVQRKGIVQSLEGPEKFQPGEYLARGVVNEEWIMLKNEEKYGTGK